jgi:Protein of unknown function (DUF3631)
MPENADNQNKTHDAVAPNPGSSGDGGSRTGPELLDDIASFIRQYLVCDNHQLTALALWIVYTWCQRYFRTAPYLDVRSPEPHCGKSLCLDVVGNICDSPECFSAPSPRTLMERLLAGRSLGQVARDGFMYPPPPFTFLIDDCHHTFGPSERQPVLGPLNAGSDSASVYARSSDDFYLFGPKAFAGNAPLPRSLAARCIPIVLRRPGPADKFERFRALQVDRLEELAKRVEQWVKDNRSGLLGARQNSASHIPPTLSPGQQDCVEPLLYIAELVGGDWPEKAYAAFTALFELADRSPSVLMLSDLRVVFSLKNNPEYLSTRDLLAALCQIEDRPWNSWGAKSGRRLGALLQPFGISSRTLSPESEPACKGYLFRDFQDAWDRYLPPLNLCSEYQEFTVAREQNVGYNGTPTDSGTLVSAIDAGSNGITE